MNKNISQVINAFLPTIVQMVIYACILVLIAYSRGGCDNKVSNLERILIETRDEFNKKCPMMVDAETRLDYVEYQPPDIFQYNYTLVNYSRVELEVEKLKNIHKQFALKLIKGKKLAKVKFATLYFRFRDKNGDFLFLNELKYQATKP